MTNQKQRFLITDVKYCEEGMTEKWSNTLIYDVQTEEAGRIILEITIDAAKNLEPCLIDCRRGLVGSVKYGNRWAAARRGCRKASRVMPHTADQYRRAAEEAKQLADKATDSWERVQLSRLARQWARLADYKARLEAKPPPRSN